MEIVPVYIKYFSAQSTDRQVYLNCAEFIGISSPEASGFV